MCLECSLVRVLLDGPYLKQKQMLKEKKDGLMQNKVREFSLNDQLCRKLFLLFLWGTCQTRGFVTSYMCFLILP